MGVIHNVDHQSLRLGIVETRELRPGNLTQWSLHGDVRVITERLMIDKF
jgi:hypothetical protein